jgi:hypothetical protein
MMQLKIAQIDKVATVAARDVFGTLQFVGSLRVPRLPVATVHQYRLLFCHASHSEPALLL